MSDITKLCSLAIPSEVVCGCGSVNKLAEFAEAERARSAALFVDGGAMKSGAADAVIARLEAALDSVTLVTDVPPEPTDAQVREIFQRVKGSKTDIVIAIGGGSVMDTAKIIAVMLANPGYLDDLTDKAAIKNKGVPLFVAPTSAGTGSEATPNAIVLIPEKKLKVGVVHPYFLPTKVALDPELTRSLPKSVTAATGLDAFCHCIETYISRKTNPFARLFGYEGMSLVCKYLRRAYEDGGDMEAREGMLRAAFFGGVAISCSSTVAVHALSYPLGGGYHIPHGVSNAVLLPFVMEYNIPAITEDIPAIAAAMDIAADSSKLGDRIVGEIFSLARDMGIPDKLEELGVKKEDIDFLAASASGVRRLLDQNPRDMTLEDIKVIYRRLF